MAEASRKKPGPADASAGGGQPLARPHQRHAPGKPTSRCRDQSLQSSALVAPPNRGSHKSCPLLWHSRAGGGAVHSIISGSHATQQFSASPPYSITLSASVSSVAGTV